jgi:hypothetical protein
MDDTQPFIGNPPAQGTVEARCKLLEKWVDIENPTAITTAASTINITALHKSSLARLLSRPINGTFIAEYERGDIGDVLFRVACNMGLEGIVSKRLGRAYGAGKCAHWIKIKNPAHPAYNRVRDKLLQSPPSRHSRRSA